jgi:putative endopeptidase
MENPIPANERSWGIAHVVQEETYRRLVSISEEASGASSAHGTSTQKIGDFWHAAMDSAASAKEGIAPLAAEFSRIQAIKDKKALLDEVSHLQYIGVGAVCGLYIFQDEKNSDRYVVHLYQGGLGLPDRDYYFDTDARQTKIRNEYVTHVGKMFELLGDTPAQAKAHAATVMSLETDLAKASRKLEALRDPHANYNAMSVTGMAKLTPSIRWRDFLEKGDIHGIDSVVVGQPEFFQQVEKSWTARSVDEWKTYLRWQLINTYAEQAGGKFDDQNFHFFGTIMNGTPEQRPQRMLDQGGELSR